MVRNAKARTSRPLRIVLSDETYIRVREMLLTHEIAPGERINIDALARELDVSQTPVREALARLESDDLVVKEPLRGYQATALLGASELQDLFQFRGIIEPWAAMTAARKITDDGRALLAAELATGKGAQAFDIEHSYEAMSEHDARFHVLVAQLSGSEFVREAYVRTHCHLHLFRLYTVLKTRQGEDRKNDAAAISQLFEMYYHPNSGFLAFTEHQGIAAAISSGDEESASALMLEHIRSSLERFGPTMSIIEENQ